MINFERFTLDNGLRVIVHKDNTTPLVAFNLLYDVGARDENPEKTGFAHLFEHLMFGGSIHIPNFDQPIENVGGENNAFTTNDITNFYITVPKDNLETAFWLESDRMLSLAFSEKSLETQRSVVIEEFKQNYLNQPYGDLWLLLRPLIYSKHPYLWATIGKEISHIENATMDDVKDFFYRFYAPNNAILSIVGNVEVDEIKQLAEKWFAPIERRNIPIRNLPVEPIQIEAKSLTVKRKVPYDSLTIAFRSGKRSDTDFFVTDFISDILSNGRSSRLYQNLVQEKTLFSSLDAYITGDLDDGLLVVSGKLNQGISIETAEKEIWNELEQLKTIEIPDKEMQKLKNKNESSIIFSELSILHKAMELAFYELMGDADLQNQILAKYNKINQSDIQRVAAQLFRKENSSTLYYLSL